MKVLGLFYVTLSRKDPGLALADEYMRGVREADVLHARHDGGRDERKSVDSVSGRSNDYWLGWVDGMTDGYEARGTSGSTSPRPPRGTRRPHPHLRLVASS